MSKTEKEREKQRMNECKETLEKINNTDCPDTKLTLLKQLAEKQYYYGLGDKYDEKVLRSLNYDEDELEGN